MATGGHLSRGDGTFEESALGGGMAVGDYDNDGLIDVLTPTFSEDFCTSRKDSVISGRRDWRWRTKVSRREVSPD
jgi:hypothetical protein